MTRALIGICCLLISCAGVTACAQPNKKPMVNNLEEQLVSPDSLIVEALGQELAEIIFSPSTIKVYTIEPKGEIAEDDYEVEPHFIRKDYVGNLDKKSIKVLNHILLSDDKSYSNDTVVAQTFYLPVVEFEFKKGKKTASVLVSPNDRSWTVQSNGKRVFNHNYHNKELVERIVATIQNIKPKTKGKDKK